MSPRKRSSTETRSEGQLSSYSTMFSRQSLAMIPRRAGLTGGIVIAMACADGHSAELEQYICLGEQSTGFVFENGRWAIGRFSVENERYVVQELSPEKGNAADTVRRFAVKRMGESQTFISCHRNGPAFQIVCGGQGLGMLINTENLRFQKLYEFGFLGGEDTREDTPSLTIGRCSRVS